MPNGHRLVKTSSRAKPVTSSANIISYTVCASPSTVTSITSLSIYTLNSNGESGLPCATPLPLLILWTGLSPIVESDFVPNIVCTYAVRFLSTRCLTISIKLCFLTQWYGEFESTTSSTLRPFRCACFTLSMALLTDFLGCKPHCSAQNLYCALSRQSTSFSTTLRR